MKRKGFTLIEMIAVIAILGILVLLVLPNILKTYRNSKKMAFIDEAKMIYTKVTDDFLLNKTKGKRVNYVSNEEANHYTLDLQNEKDLKYTITLNNKGVVTGFLLKNTDFCIVGVGDFLNDYTIDQVIDLRDNGNGVDEEETQKCEIEVFQDGTELYLDLVNKISDSDVGATLAKPDLLTLTYGSGWYDRQTKESLSVGDEYSIRTIPHKYNHYYEKSTTDNIDVVSCNGTILIDDQGNTDNLQQFYAKGEMRKKAVSEFSKKFYTVNFKLNEKETGSINPITCYYGESCKLPNNLDNNGYGLSIKKIGYLFKGWKYSGVTFENNGTLPSLNDDNEDKTIDGIDLSKFKFDNVEVCKNGESTNNRNKKPFEAIWEPIKYTVAYNCNGGTGSTAPSTHTYDIEKELTSNGCSRVGYNFLGWSRNKNTTTKEFSNEQSVKNLTTTNNDTVTLYAVWLANTYTITLNNQSATSAGTTTVYEKYATGWYSNSTTTTKITSITKPTRAGYTFGGYYTSTNGVGIQVINANGAFVSNTPTAFTSNGTLYAKWTANTYTITLNNQSATSSGTATVYEKYATGWYSNSTATTKITSITKPTRTGYTFGGYYTSTNGVGTQVINANGAFVSNTPTTFSSNGTLYAVWKLEITSNKLIVDANGGHGGFEVVQKEKTTVNINVSLDASHRLGSWDASGTCGTFEQKANTTYTFPRGDNTECRLKANWGKYLNTLVVDTNGGSGDLSVLKYGGETQAISVDRCGYIFAGWEKTGDCGTYGENASTTYTFPYKFGTKCTLKAKWVTYGYTVDACIKENESKTYPNCLSSVTVNSNNDTACKIKSNSTNLDAIRWIKSDSAFAVTWVLQANCPSVCSGLGYAYWGGGNGSTAPTANGAVNGNTCWCGYKTSDLSCGITWVKSDSSYYRYSNTALNCPNNCQTLGYKYWGGSSESEAPLVPGKSSGTRCWCGYDSTDVSCGINWVKSDYSYYLYSNTALNCPQNCKTLGYEYWGGSSDSTPPASPGKSNGTRCWCGYGINTKTCGVVWVKSDSSYSSSSITASNCPQNCQTLGYEYWGGSSSDAAPITAGKSNGNWCWCGYKGSDVSCDISWVKSDSSYYRYANTAANCKDNCAVLGYEYWGGSSESEAPSVPGKSNGTRCWCGYNPAENRTDITWIKSDSLYNRYSFVAANCPGNCSALKYKYWGGSSENQAPLVPGKSNGNRCWCGIDTVVDTRKLTWVRSDSSYYRYSFAAANCPNNCKTLGYEYWGSNNSDTNHPTKVGVSEGTRCWCAYNTSENRTNISWIKSDSSYYRYSFVAANCPNNCKTLGYDYWGGSSENQAPLVPGKSSGTRCWCGYDTVAENKNLTWVRSDSTYGTYSNAAANCPNNCKTLGYQYWGSNNSNTDHPTILNRSNGRNCWCAYNTSENRTDITWVRSNYAYGTYSNAAANCPTNCKNLGYKYWGGSNASTAPLVPGKSNGNWCWCGK